MNDNQKPGGGNKPQPYIPAGNGKKSGQYTNKPSTGSTTTECYIKNIKRKYNFRNSLLVNKVSKIISVGINTSIPMSNGANTVVKKVSNGYVLTERYYNEKGEAYIDIDYTCHGNPVTHPVVPHIHRWIKDKNGITRRGKWEDFQ